MNIKSEAKLRNVAGERIVMGAVSGTVDMTRVISLNDSAAFLWESLHGREFEAADVVELLEAEYGVGAEVAERDAGAWIRQMQEAGLI